MAQRNHLPPLRLGCRASFHRDSPHLAMLSIKNGTVMEDSPTRVSSLASDIGVHYIRVSGRESPFFVLGQNKRTGRESCPHRHSNPRAVQVHKGLSLVGSFYHAHVTLDGNAELFLVGGDAVEPASGDGPHAGPLVRTAEDAAEAGFSAPGKEISRVWADFPATDNCPHLSFTPFKHSPPLVHTSAPVGTTVLFQRGVSAPGCTFLAAFASHKEDFPAIVCRVVPQCGRAYVYL